MNETEKNYRRVMSSLGSKLLLFLLMLYASTFAVQFLAALLAPYMSAQSNEIIFGILSAVVYFASFTLAAWFYHLTAKKVRPEPVRFTPKLPANAFLIIFAGVACTFTLSMINSIAVSLLGFGGGEEIFRYPTEFSKDSSIIIQFISVAIVPAFCEEVLFRGVVLSNLMPYGKANAILVSALLFGLMHGNLYQFLYATAAGIVMGCVYVLTESIWCSILLHFINNTISVFQLAITDRFSAEYSWIIVAVMACILLFVGIVCAYFIITKKDKEGRGVAFESLTFSKRMTPAQCAKGFLVPTVLIFSIISILLALMTVSLV